MLQFEFEMGLTPDESQEQEDILFSSFEAFMKAVVTSYGATKLSSDLQDILDDSDLGLPEK